MHLYSHSTSTTPSRQFNYFLPSYLLSPICSPKSFVLHNPFYFLLLYISSYSLSFTYLKLDLYLGSRHVYTQHKLLFFVLIYIKSYKPRLYLAGPTISCFIFSPFRFPVFLFFDSLDKKKNTEQVIGGRNKRWKKRYIIKLTILQICG